MKRNIVFALFFMLALVLSTGHIYAQSQKTMSQTGKVTAIDPEGKAIVIEAGKGKAALTVGAAIGSDTKLTVKGKNVPLSDLQKDVQVGDTVTLKYYKTDDLYAKQIVKK
ncbi:MAG: hypothetical protein ABSE25_11130 [Syntrophorhabdales bacterium]|jgi:hypothetical protein